MTDGMTDTSERRAQEDFAAEILYRNAAIQEGLLDDGNMPNRAASEMERRKHVYGMGFRAALVYIRMDRVAKGKAP